MLILHIGRHKCGSSSIQYFMSCNAEKLAEFGVLYTKIGRNRRAHHVLADQLRNDLPSGIQEVLALETSVPGGKVILSSESFELLKPYQIAELKRQIGDAQVLIVMYIRDLVGWFPSKYNELTKKGNNLEDFDQFYARHDPSNGFKLTSRAEDWARVFGWDNLRIRLLDSRSLTGGSLIEDFVSVLGLSLSDLGGPNAAGLELQNVSNGWKVLEVLRPQYAQLAAHREHHEIRRKRPKIIRGIASALRKSVAEIMNDLGLSRERTQYISARQWEKCNAIFSREILKLNERIVGPKLPLPNPAAVKERPFLPSIDHIPSDERREIARRLEAVLIGEERSFIIPRQLHRSRPSFGSTLFGSNRPSRSLATLDRVGVDRELRRSLIGTLTSMPPGE